jgi:N-acetylglucosamine-6-sulfatase
LAHVPPGWTNWQGLKGNSVYYNYSLSNNGVPEHHGTDYATDYLPNVIRNKTLDFLAANLGGPAPVFAVLSTPSCHGPQDAAPQYQGAFPGAAAPRLPNYNATVAGAPPVHWLQASHGAYVFHDDAAAFADLVFRRRLQTLLTVDDILADVVAAVGAAGELDNTFFVYTADNGYHTGQFGLVYDKRNAFEADTHLPMLIRGPGVAPGAAVGAPFSMVDLSATLLDMAGVAPPPHFDGASLLPFAGGGAAPPPRLATLVEYVGEGDDDVRNGAVCAATNGQRNLMCNPAGNYTLPPFFHGRDFCLCQDARNNTYACLRFVGGAHADAEKAQMVSPGATPHAPPAAVDFRYCEYRDAVSTVEYFDLTGDPYELENKAGGMDPALKGRLSERLAQARACKGAPQCDAVLSAPL